MKELIRLLEATEVWFFSALAVVAVYQFVRHRSPPAAWAAATFSILGIVVLASRFVPEDPGTGTLWARKLLIALVVLFPYCLFRFGTSFHQAGTALHAAANAITGVAVGVVFLFDELPAAGEPRPTGFVAYSFLILVQWATLSLYVAAVLWRSGRGRPTVIRRRMRTLAVGALGLVLAILLAVVAPPDDEGGVVSLAVAVAALAAGILFILGLAPPAILLVWWRRPEVDALYDAEAGLMAATTTAEVAGSLLPHVASTMGASAAVLTTSAGEIVGSFGPADALADALSDEAISVPLRGGRLAVAGDAYTPFFGRNETILLERVARLTDVALRRAELTERERTLAAELETSNRAMRSFVAVASHDLRTPIAAIRGFAELIQAQSGSNGDGRTETQDQNQNQNQNQTKAYLGTIVRQADHVSRIVSDLLTVSRIDSGAIEPASERVPLLEAVTEVLTDLNARGIEVTVDGGLVVRGDPDQVRRMLRNLIENARNYGDPPIDIAGLEVDGAVEIRIRDHGAGVAEEFEPRLFERFARADKAKSRAKHGTGLGLSIAQGLARAGGGDAWFQRVHPGACFVVRLPLHRDHEEQA